MRAILNCFGRKNRITVRLAYSVTRGLREGGGFKIVGETGEIKLYRFELRNRPEAI